MDIISLLSTDGYIMCNKKLIKEFGGDCAIIIGELCAEYNYYKALGRLTEENSFYSTQENIEDNTGLNPYAQRKALKALQDADIIRISKQGLPAKNHYWINQSKLLDFFSSSNFEGLEVQNLDINNNKAKKNNNPLSKDNGNSRSTENTTGNVTAIPVDKPKKKKSRYEQYMDVIENYTDNEELRQSLCDHIKMILEMKDKPVYANQYKSMIKKLRELSADESVQAKIVRQSTECGWVSFYELKENKSYNKPNKGLQMTMPDAKSFNSKDEAEQFTENLKKEAESSGRRAIF